MDKQTRDLKQGIADLQEQIRVEEGRKAALTRRLDKGCANSWLVCVYVCVCRWARVVYPVFYVSCVRVFLFACLSFVGQCVGACVCRTTTGMPSLRARVATLLQHRRRAPV
jgi:hypothetical protein